MAKNWSQVLRELQPLKLTALPIPILEMRNTETLKAESEQGSCRALRELLLPRLWALLLAALSAPISLWVSSSELPHPPGQPQQLLASTPSPAVRASRGAFAGWGRAQDRPVSLSAHSGAGLHHPFPAPPQLPTGCLADGHSSPCWGGGVT